MPWSRMFGIMEQSKRELHVEDYSISQTTLEQIFLQFTKYQKEEGGAEDEENVSGATNKKTWRKGLIKKNRFKISGIKKRRWRLRFKRFMHGLKKMKL